MCRSFSIGRSASRTANTPPAPTYLKRSASAAGTACVHASSVIAPSAPPTGWSFATVTWPFVDQYSLTGRLASAATRGHCTSWRLSHTAFASVLLTERRSGAEV